MGLQNKNALLIGLVSLFPLGGTLANADDVNILSSREINQQKATQGQFLLAQNESSMTSGMSGMAASTSGSQPTGMEGKTEAAKSTTPLTPETVLISKGDLKVTMLDLEAELMMMPAQMRGNVMGSEPHMTRVLENILARKLIAKEAVDLSLASDPLVEKQVEHVKEGILGERRISLLLSEAQKKMPDMTEEAKKSYESSKERYQSPERVKASHILIMTKNRTEEEAKALAEKVHAEVVKGEKSFADLATQYSEDPSVKTNKGDLGFFARQQMVKPFEDAAFALAKEGDISSLVKSQFGFHIIRLEGKEAGRQLSFDEVKDKIVDAEKRKYLQKARRDYLDKVRTKEGVTTNQDAIAQLKAANAAADSMDSEGMKPEGMKPEGMK